MTDLLWHSFVASFVGSGLSLDRKVAFQVMVSRPLVVATVIGFLLGSTTGGLSVGLFFELLFVGDLPIGGYLPSHETAITVVCTAISLFCSTLFGLGSDIFPMITLSTLLVIPLGFVFNGADRVARGYNARFFYDAEERMVRDYRIGLRKNFEGILSLFVATFISTFALIIAGAALVSALYPLLPDLVVTKLLPMIWISLILIGFAATYKSAYSDKVRPIFCGAVALAVAVYLLVSHGW